MVPTNARTHERTNARTHARTHARSHATNLLVLPRQWIQAPLARVEIERFVTRLQAQNLATLGMVVLREAVFTLLIEVQRAEGKRTPVRGNAPHDLPQVIGGIARLQANVRQVGIHPGHTGIAFAGQSQGVTIAVRFNLKSGAVAVFASANPQLIAGGTAA